MNKNLVVIIILVAVVTGGIIVYQQQQADNQEQIRLENIAEAKKLAAEAKIAKEKALEEARHVEAEKVKTKALEEARIAAEKATQEALEASRIAEEAFKQKAEELKAKISELNTQAQSLLDGGNYQAALDTARSIINLDANNPLANSIITAAGVKLHEMAETVTEEAKEAVGDLGANIDVPVPTATE